ncbi:hypothetical protein JCGZ_05947 [Jatropha curcas]|uniref:Uncharacterized protein n=1 Tax=Jatropha curcas TaxID=180498 RepID=A0A067KR65_JATCU|nr:hypothetical protein JCGZ_05947 [Jatropha curcas]
MSWRFHSTNPWSWFALCEEYQKAPILPKPSELLSRRGLGLLLRQSETAANSMAADVSIASSSIRSTEDDIGAPSSKTRARTKDGTNRSNAEIGQELANASFCSHYVIKSRQDKSKLLE